LPDLHRKIFSLGTSRRTQGAEREAQSGANADKQPMQAAAPHRRVGDTHVERAHDAAAYLASDLRANASACHA